MKLLNQNEIFDLLAQRFKTKSAMYREIAEFTNVGPEAVAKWGSGNTVLGLDRLSLLVQKYELGPQYLYASEPGTVVFNFIPLKLQNLTKYYAYILNLEQLLGSLRATQPDIEINFVADDIPIFYFMPFQNLTHFKLYAYYCDMLRSENIKEEEMMKFEAFAEELKKLNLKPIFENIRNHYDHIASNEIWDDYILDALLFQLEDFHFLNRFENPASKEIILDELTELVNGFFENAKSDKKYTGARFAFFKKRFPNRMGYMLVKSQAKKLFTIKLDSINSMMTTDEHMINLFNNSFESAINRSRSIGMADERERVIFHRNLIEKIQKVRNVCCGKSE